MKIDILEKIEGEAYLQYSFKEEKIDDVYVQFIHYRGVEEILKNRPFLDALVIAPRVCGICGHAHLQAAAGAIEHAFGIEPTQKAKDIKDITRFCEIIQNHIKWFSLVILPFTGIKYDFALFHRLIITTNRLLALFAGQWPHSSYVLPGGVTADPTEFEIYQAKSLITQIKKEFEEIFGEFDSLQTLSNITKMFYDYCKEEHLEHIGKGYDRFITLSQDRVVQNIKILKGVKREAKIRFITESTQPHSSAKNVTYKNTYYETGPLARMMQKKPKIIRQLHRRYKDGLLTRVFARIYEAKMLIDEIENIMHSIDLSQPSFLGEDYKRSGYGECSIEAARGSLVHKIWIADGKIEHYEIITPTQWNLSNGTKQNPSTIQKAIIGLKSKTIAELVFRSFDICSVCTTH